jgi:hypothetical protein
MKRNDKTTEKKIKKDTQKENKNITEEKENYA